jgi:CheY-like chemotaxis protein
MLGHELRNPLHTILLAADLVEASVGQPRAMRSKIDTIRRLGRHLSRLVDDLLDVARVTSGKVVLTREIVDLRELATRCVAVAQPAARARTQALELTIVGACIEVDGDPVRLEQVLGNLITNAIKYTPPGGHIGVALGIEHGRVILRVSDDGMGLGEEFLPRVFELFTQADRTLDRAQGGLGIGLTLVRSLVELHGGQVHAVSDGVGKGSTFTIDLPVARPSPPSSHRPKVGEPRRCRRVLIVEDQDDTRELMHRLVESFGHHVAVAADGGEAVARAMADHPEIMLVDVGLPVLDGYEVARRVRAQLGDAIRLIAITGYGLPDDQRRAREAGFDIHLTKPIDVEQLASLLASR